ncbi:uncharacterized protein sstn isoform X2 [Prorops nasuta]|uniref:uncharacterized protein sstn isoform X2 n=1 Tax=Prorops nasuta TaxID=863751 RepID=UPI0034CD7BF3
MVMAGNDNMQGPLVDESLSTRLQWLRQRREALQEKLAQKNNELKTLCVEEAELTGILPPEIPLEPGESPPAFCRKVKTNYSYPQNIINKLKTNDAESTLELEQQMLVNKMEAALSIINDPNKNKTVRRKERMIYQQAQQRLQEVEVRLSFIRQSRGKIYPRPVQHQYGPVYNLHPHLHSNVKHRTKKPRPPLESTGSEGGIKSTHSIIHEDGINISGLLNTEQKTDVYPVHGYDDQLTVSNVSNHNRSTYSSAASLDRQNMKIVEHDHNDNHNVYILSDQYRSRTYSHGSSGSRNYNRYQETERSYRPVPNTYNEEERQMRLCYLQQQKQQQDMLQNHHSYPDFKIIENERKPMLYHDKEYRNLHYTQGPDYHAFCKTQQQLPPLQKRESANIDSRNSGLTELPPGYWVRYEDEVVWCPEEPTGSDRFGSLDRRKCTNLQYTNVETQSRYHTVAIGPKATNSISRHQPQSTHLLPFKEPTPPNNRMLLRTQSLGSVETWYSGNSYDGQDKDTDSIGKKGRQKEWYETSLDSGTSPGIDLSISHKSHHHNHHQHHHQHHQTPSVKSIEEVKDKFYHNQPNQKKNDIVEDQYVQPSQYRYEPPRRVLEIPAESKPLQQLDPEDPTLSLGSPQNCTIVQAGKYQPYREITKPFEMSDFYKYSTKFRKRNEAAENSNGNKVEQKSEASGSDQNSTANNNVASPVQKRIYQPVQRMTCQPYLTTFR